MHNTTTIPSVSRHQIKLSHLDGSGKETVKLLDLGDGGKVDGLLSVEVKDDTSEDGGLDLQ
jgi:hypothetical protein